MSESLTGFAEYPLLVDDLRLGALVDSPALRRLERVSFLGVIGPGAESDARDNRWAHSMRAAAIAVERARELGASLDTVRHLAAAALVHDIAHRAFSHTLERVYALLTHQTPRQTTYQQVLDESLDDSVGVVTALHAASLTPSRVLTFLDDRLAHLRTVDDAPFAEWWRGALSPDTLDGIQRTLALVGREAHADWFDDVFTWTEARAIGVRRDQLCRVDEFWRAKSWAYEWINAQSSHEVAFAESVYRRLAPDLSSRESFRLREDELERHRHDGLTPVEEYHALFSNEYLLRFRLARRYWVDADVTPTREAASPAELRQRYRSAAAQPTHAH